MKCIMKMKGNTEQSDIYIYQYMKDDDTAADEDDDSHPSMLLSPVFIQHEKLNSHQRKSCLSILMFSVVSRLDESLGRASGSCKLNHINSILGFPHRSYQVCY